MTTQLDSATPISSTRRQFRQLESVYGRFGPFSLRTHALYPALPSAMQCMLTRIQNVLKWRMPCLKYRPMCRPTV